VSFGNEPAGQKDGHGVSTLIDDRYRSFAKSGVEPVLDRLRNHWFELGGYLRYIDRRKDAATALKEDVDTVRKAIEQITPN
jgi:hypothetical protein